MDINGPTLDFDRQSRSPLPTLDSNMSVMRIAIAGTSGLALTIAREILERTSHQLVILSRNVSAAVSMVNPCVGANGSDSNVLH